MRAVTWQGRREVRVEDVPDPVIEEPTDAIVQITSTAICGSDLHLYEVLGPFLKPGDVLGHEPMGVVMEVGPDVTHIQPGDRVVVPFNNPMPMREMFDRGIQLRMGQAHVKRWVDELLPLVSDDADPLGVLDLTTHQVPLAEAPQMYETFQKKQDDCIKVVLKP